MDADQLSSLNTWMAIVAIASVVQVVAIGAIAVFGYRAYAHVEPLARHANDVLLNVNAEVARLRQAGDRVQGTVEAVHSGVSHAASAVTTALWPGWAVVRGVLAAVSAFRNSGRRKSIR